MQFLRQAHSGVGRGQLGLGEDDAQPQAGGTAAVPH